MNARAERQQRRNEAKAEYRDMTRQLYELNQQRDIKEIQDVLTDQLEKGVKLYPLVKKKLDGTAIDSKHVKELSTLGREAATRINVHAQPFDLARILKDWMRNDDGTKRQRFELTDQFQVKDCFCIPPTLEFFYGALRIEDIVKVERRRRVKERLVETQTKKAKLMDAETEVQQDSTPKEVELINRKIQRIAKDQPKGVPFFQNLVDSNSFAQTVENIFHASFLVKDGQVGLKRSETGNAVIVLQDEEAGQNQSVLSFSIDDYNRWIGKKSK